MTDEQVVTLGNALRDLKRYHASVPDDAVTRLTLVNTDSTCVVYVATDPDVIEILDAFVKKEMVCTGVERSRPLR